MLGAQRDTHSNGENEEFWDRALAETKLVSFADMKPKTNCRRGHTWILFWMEAKVRNNDGVISAGRGQNGACPTSVQ